MRREEILEFVNGTAEPAFVLDPTGAVAAWNLAAEEFFGLRSEQAIGRLCSDVLHGIGECGRECNSDCAVKRRAKNRDPLKSYEVQVETPTGKKWCSMIVIMPPNVGSGFGYTMHIAKSVDLQKRFENLMRDFVGSQTDLPIAISNQIGAVRSSPTALVDLTNRELDILRHVAKGKTSAHIANELKISATTVNNHVQRILKKLSAHTRLEAVRLAEKARLI